MNHCKRNINCAMRRHVISFKVFRALCLLSVCHSAYFTSNTIETKMCDTFCSNRNTNCVVFETPVGVCYNGQSLFPNDPSWGEYDIRDVVVDFSSFVRTFYATVDESCRNSTDLFSLPFDECVGPFGQPFPWGKFSLLHLDDSIHPRNF
jgi:hypothetical protein